MKPVGLVDPRTGRFPYAAVQLRQETSRATISVSSAYTDSLKWGEQASRVLRMVPGLENARVRSLRMVHRNTYIMDPRCCARRGRRRTAGSVLRREISGVEGYVESAASGLIGRAQRGRDRSRRGTADAARTTPSSRSRITCRTADPRHYQPTNITFGFMPPWTDRLVERWIASWRSRSARCVISMLDHACRGHDGVKDHLREFLDYLRLNR